MLTLVACGSGRKVIRETEETAPPRGPNRAVRLEVVTFNVQDLFVADRRAERMRAIGRLLGPRRPDVVCLQEAFTSTNRDALRRTLEATSNERYETIYFPSGVMGSGLCVLTRHPVSRAIFWRYSKNGAWYQFKHGDWYAGKGAAAVRIEIGGGSIDILNTHAIANYNTVTYREDRIVQLRELRGFLDKEATVPAPALLVGDLNCLPRHTEYKELVRPPIEDLIGRIDPTDESRIDHVLVRTVPGYVVEPLELRLLYNGVDDDGERIDLSDHPGVLMRIEIRPEG
jgi:sphingomyelin phosphodiesterase 2